MRFGGKPSEGVNSTTKASFWEKKPWQVIVGIVAVCGVISNAYSPAMEMIKGTKEVAAVVAEKVPGPLDLVSLRLEDVKVETNFSDATFVRRPGIEKILRKAIYSSRPTHYHIVYGAKGVGKTSLVEYVAAGRKGVVRVKVESTDKIETMTAKFMKTVTGKNETIDTVTLRAALVEYTRIVTIKAQVKAHSAGDRSHVKGDFIPTIIFEVERGSAGDVNHKEVMQQVRILAKEISNVCNCIIVVSDANAVFKFGRDSRENFIYVDEMTFEEAKAFLNGKMTYFTDVDRKTIFLSDDEYKMIYDNIGGNPIDLVDLLKRMAKHPLDVCIKSILSSASQDLKAFELKPILKALKEYPEGVPAGDFDGQRYMGVNLADPKAVGDAMESRNAIVYRMDLIPDMLYQMQSTKHRNALKSYEPIIDNYALNLPMAMPKA